MIETNSRGSMFPSEVITLPHPFARQVSASDPDGNRILAVIAKRSYRYDETGHCRLHEVPVPLVEAPTLVEESEELAHDSDLYPFKLKTDVVLHARAGQGGPCTEIECAVRVGDYEKRIAVLGDRRCAISSTGELIFSRPESFSSMPLSYRCAYGGRDKAAHQLTGNPLEPVQPYFQPDYDLSDFSLFDYPRNPAGKGYLCYWDRENVEALQLPNLEDPLDRLSPQRLLLESWDQWPVMPMPQGIGWVNHTWFPRTVYFGFVPHHDINFNRIPETSRGFAALDILERKPYTEKISFLGTQGASLGLQFPYLQGNERIELLNVLPDVQSVIQLPGDRPTIHVDGRNGKLLETNPVIHSVLIEPNDHRVSIVWRGHGQAIRPYMDEELKTMPLRVEW
jgi:hypothetical protein